MNILNVSSPNYNKPRKRRSIKFIILHYTGMQSTIESLSRLRSKKSKVSAHYLISRNGIIYRMVEDKNIAWHAGKSKWKNLNNLNEYSIGVEIQNLGHKIGYQKFTKSQINGVKKLCRFLVKKHYISNVCKRSY